ncbi:PREDICTED: probable gamma-secretase subunit PEN-2 [Tarenaya hassleriana]|uniref:probable gamma-secretase subunit PEN-2 n=1 Tax=Tarenaya hassleriana TaxID=28532 RepID=UPI0008FD1B60|nr:PREDICTED: probable gamma-secretase subunit PEN-2 [Tarenaya hassleriana]
MEASRSDGPNPSQNQSSSSPIMSLGPVWPTIDGPLGLTEEASVDYARRFYRFGFALLPWLWAVNCFYFWPVLRHSRSFPRIRHYVVGSAIGFTVFSALLSAWALTFAIGGEQLFGPVWDKLVMYNVADRLGLSGLA